MPRDVAVVLPGRRVAASEIATAITVARSLIASGRHVTFYHGYGRCRNSPSATTPGRWTRGHRSGRPAVPRPSASSIRRSRRLAGRSRLVRHARRRSRRRVRRRLLVSDGERGARRPAVREARCWPRRAASSRRRSATPRRSIAADRPRDFRSARRAAGAGRSVRPRRSRRCPSTRDGLPAGTRPSRLLLDVMVAPDGAGEKAVVSAFVNERLLGSTVAATGEATHLDLALPDGLVGTIANVRVVVQRDSAQGDCRFEPQGYPAQILGSSALVLATPTARRTISPISRRALRSGSKFCCRRAPPISRIACSAWSPKWPMQLSPDTAPLAVDSRRRRQRAAAGSARSSPSAIRRPTAAAPRVRFDRGRVAVTDRAGRTLLDLGGFVGGAVAQIVTAGDHPGLWIKPLSADGIAAVAAATSPRSRRRRLRR